MIPSDFAIKRQTYVQKDLTAGSAFERYIGSILEKMSYRVEYPNSEVNAESEAYIQNYASIQIQLAKALDIQAKVTEIKNLYFECSWRGIGYFLKKKTHTGIPLFKYQNYSENRAPETFIIIGHGGRPENPEKVFITTLQKFSDFGETIVYDLFKGNKARHSPHQRALALKHFKILERSDEMEKYFRDSIQNL